jgi:hypothetical protein
VHRHVASDNVPRIPSDTPIDIPDVTTAEIVAKEPTVPLTKRRRVHDEDIVGIVWTKYNSNVVQI